MLKMLGKLFFDFERFKNRCISAYYIGRFKSGGGYNLHREKLYFYP